MLGYCTNVHRGASFQDVVSNLQTYTKSVQEKFQHDLGVGIWLSDQASQQTDIQMLKDTLQACRLTLFTLNGFPFSDFHEDVVQHKVYEPDWSDEHRLSYTLRLARILAAVTNEKEAGISTLPLGWGDASFTNENAAGLMKRCVNELEIIEQETGTCIHIDIETEPGCRLQRSSDLGEFLNRHFGDDERIRRYLRVCHDTCHAAVMRESAEECVENYNNAGLAIGKVQLSTALEVDFQTQDAERYINDLKSFSEPRYLHQTTISTENGIRFFENLADVSMENPTGVWRIHFHVPIHLQQLGSLNTTQEELSRSIPILLEAGVTNWEVETYTWSVMPATMKEGELVDSIVKELEWASNHIHI